MLGIILGIVVGVCVSVMIIGVAVNKSNNKGDSKAAYLHFSQEPLEILEKKDRGKKEFPLYY